MTAENEAERNQRLLNESLKAYVGAASEATDQVDVMKLKFELAREGLLSKKEVLAEYNKILGTTLGMTKSFNEAEQTTIDNADTYIKIVGLKAQAQALANLRIKESEKATTAELGLDDNRNFAAKAARYLLHGNDADYDKQVEDDKKRFNSAIKVDADSKIDAITKMEMQVQTELAAVQIPFKDKPKNLSDLKAGKEKERKQIENIYEQELLKLRADIAKLDEKGFTDEATITAAIEADFKKKDLAFQKAFKNKQLTAGQSASLQDNLKNLQQLTLDKSLKDFATKKQDYLTKLNNEISSVQLQSATQNVQFIQDDFERQRQTIELESKKTIDAAKRSRDAKLAEVAKSTILKPDEIKQKQDEITQTYSDWFDSLEQLKNQKLQKLSFDTFNKLGDNLQRTFNSKDLHISENQLLDIQEQNKLLAAGKISYKQWQDSITQIAKDAADQRFEIEKEKLTKEIQALENKLVVDAVQDKDSKDKLTQDQVKQLEDKIVDLKKRLADATGQHDKSDVIDPGDSGGLDNALSKIAEYVKAVNDVVQQVGSFWQQVNDLEEKSLERSIAIQDRRVDAARNVAEKGNAEYLRLEEEKQQALLLKQENAARRQMAINAALQASQLLVAITSAIASAAAATGPAAPFVIAGDIAAIVGALAAGYILVKSLNQNQPSFYVGTEDTGHGGEVDSKGGFNAVLHPHERVLTAEENKQLKGISNKQLIETVQKHRVMVESWKAKPAPQLNIAAMEMATNVGNGESSRLAGILEENNRKMDENNIMQKRIVQTLKSMEMSVSLDQRGFHASFMKIADEYNKSKKC